MAGGPRQRHRCVHVASVTFGGKAQVRLACFGQSMMLRARLVDDPRHRRARAAERGGRRGDVEAEARGGAVVLRHAAAVGRPQLFARARGRLVERARRVLAVAQRVVVREFGADYPAEVTEYHATRKKKVRGEEIVVKDGRHELKYDDGVVMKVAMRSQTFHLEGLPTTTLWTPEQSAAAT